MIEDFLHGLPASLQETVSNAWNEYICNCGKLQIKPLSDERMLSAIGTVWASSRFVANYCIRHPTILHELVDSGDLFSNTARENYRARLKSAIETGESIEDLMPILRQCRNREMLRIAWRDLAQWAELEETLNDLSVLAEVYVQESLDFLYQKACERRGVPFCGDGTPQQLVVLAMGKLGAWELNFSSDIDLIFAYPEEGVLPDKHETSYNEFFTKLCRALVKVLDAKTEEGFVFRVDTRLRPFGESGPLAMSFHAMETYYQSQAREWERYAMIKVRPVAGDLAAGEKLQKMLRPFVYRRYLDYRAFGELRELKFKISQELQRKDRLENIKLGPGGIREIEFIAQTFQLIRGGREKKLQERRLLKVLKTLGEFSHLPLPIVEKLIGAYCYLRTVENRLQEYADQQTHELPLHADQQLRLAYALGYDRWEAFKQELDEIRKFVHEVFEQVIESPHAGINYGSEAIVWAGKGDEEQLLEALYGLGFFQPKNALKILQDFRSAHALKKLSARGAAELDRLMPMVLGVVGKAAQPELTLKRTLDLLEAIASRNVYLTLLAENPLALSQLVKLAAASSWIASYLARFPLLLDELLDPRTLYAPLSKAELEQEAEQQLQAADADDLEQLMGELRHFKQANVLRVAAADIANAIPIMVVSDYLTDIAEVILNQVLKLAWRSVAKRHGVPAGAQQQEATGFAIIAYGKLGGLELGYGSDLDLVFLYDGSKANALTGGDRPISGAQFYLRLGQRIIHILTAKMLSGVLYEVDMRLRPSGNAGLLVSSVDAYEAYQAREAWIWEHQALVRARFVAGDSAIAARFRRIRLTILSQKRTILELKQEVKGMRAKMRANLAVRDPNVFDIKQGIGGIADIEFIVQFGTLLCANGREELFEVTDNIRLLDSLKEIGFIDQENAALLKEAYCRYRDRAHSLALQENPAIVSDEEFLALRSGVKRIWQKLFE